MKAESRAETDSELGRVETTRFLDQSETPHRLSAQKKNGTGEGNVRGSAYPMRVARLRRATPPRDIPSRPSLPMALSDATNVGALASTALAAPVKSASPSSAPPAMAAPNAEKLAAALDDVAGVDAAARDAAESKLDAASAKDAPGLCAALLAIAADPACVPARRLAAATFARNILRKAWGARDADADADVDAGPRIPPDARPAVRAAALSALVAAPADARRLLADCLRLASTSAARDTRDESASASASDAPSALVDDVVAAAANIPGTLPPGLLLAAHVAALPFQYFRDLTVAREAPPPRSNACVLISSRPAVPRFATPRSRPSPKTPRRRRASRSRRSTASFARTCPRRFVRLSGTSRARSTPSRAPSSPPPRRTPRRFRRRRGSRRNEGCGSARRSCRDTPRRSTKRRWRRSSAPRDASRRSRRASRHPPAAAAAFATLAAVVERGDAGAYNALTTSDGPDDDASRTARLSALVRECVVPHVSLTDADREMLAEDPEEYARGRVRRRRRRRTPRRRRWTGRAGAGSPRVARRWISSPRSSPRARPDRTRREPPNRR